MNSINNINNIINSSSSSSMITLLRRKRMLVVAAATTLLIATALAVITAMPDSTSSAATVAASTASTAQPLLLVPADLVTVDGGRMAHGIRVSGTLEPLHQARVNAHAGATLDAVLVREGERVKRGQVLIRQNSADPAAKLQQALAQLASSQVEMALYIGLEKKKSELYEKKYISELDWETVKGETAVKRSRVQIEEANVAIARKALADTHIVAPISGIVAARHVEPGSHVMPGQALLDLVDLSELELAAAIPARDVPQVRVGNRVTFTVDGHGTREFSGTIVRINPMANGSSRTITLHARVANKDGTLKGGMFANGHITTGTSNRTDGKTLRIPAAAVRHIDDKDQVWVIRNDTLALQPVTPGARDAGTAMVEIKQGLVAGERILLTDPGKRAIGMPVSVADSH